MPNHGIMTEKDWKQRMKRSHPDHAIIRGLYWKPIQVRTLNTLARNAGGTYRTHQDIVAMTYGQFLVELAKPDGGKVARAHGIGKTCIEELRRLCFDDLTQSPVEGEYGYA
jgi:hypothetical protein